LSLLSSRPAYGEGEPRVPKGQSGLPSGGPAKRGLPLDDSIPGTKTFVKPLDENSTPEPKDESIHRIDNPKDMPKDQSRPNEVEMDGNTSYYGLGKSDNTKTKYPYRDGIPNAHNAAAFVEGMCILKDRVDRLVPPTGKIAATISQMLEGLNPEFSSRSKSCAVTLKRADVPNLRWIFAVDSGNGPKVVHEGIVLGLGNRGIGVQFFQQIVVAVLLGKLVVLASV